MRRKSMNKSLALTLLGAFVLAGPSSAQFTFGGQLVQRGEYRNGYGKLIPEGADPAMFISQRSRIQGEYQHGRMRMFLSVQDVRTWGNTPQLNSTDSSLSAHEAFVEIRLDTNWTMKLGRQELNYDNARFLGNVDWALQGRSHDMALIKFERNAYKLHFGGGFNEDSESLTWDPYSTRGQYRTALMLHGERKFRRLDLAVLFWNNGRQFVDRDSADVITGHGIRSSRTLGISTLKYQWKQNGISGFAYYQTGRDVKNTPINAVDMGVQLTRLFHTNDAKKNQLRLTLGGELISGNATGASSDRNKAFSPMYGTNHMHNGYMDLFFVGGRYEGLTGLKDLFVLTRFDISSAFFISMNGHLFSTYADYAVNGVVQDRMLGTELDATAGYVLSNSVSFQAGYSQLFATSTLEKIQNVPDPQSIQNWAYLMIVFRPGSDKKFIGLMH